MPTDARILRCSAASASATAGANSSAGGTTDEKALIGEAAKVSGGEDEMEVGVPMLVVETV